MSDDRPIRRTDEPTPPGEPAAVTSPDGVTEVHGAPAESRDASGPAHRAESPGDAAPETGGREGAGGWVTAEPPAVENEEGRLVTVAGPDSAGAHSGSRPEPGAEILPDALPHGDHGSAHAAERPLSPAEQPTTEAPSLAQARADRAQQAPAVGAASDAGATTIHEARPEESRETHAAAAPATAPAPVPTPTTPVQQTGEQPVAAPPAPVPVYIESPVPPKKKGNRGFGVAMSLLGTLVYALVWAGVAALIIALNTAGDRAPQSLTTFLASPVYWLPIIAFALSMILLALLVNRGGWAWWLIGGFLVAVAVCFGFLGGGLLAVAQQITPGEVAGFVWSIAASPLAIASAVVAREVSIWFGLAASARGKKVKARNQDARQGFEKEQGERRAEYDRARAGIAGSQPS